MPACHVQDPGLGNSVPFGAPTQTQRWSCSHTSVGCSTEANSARTRPSPDRPLLFTNTVNGRKFHTRALAGHGLRRTLTDTGLCSSGLSQDGNPWKRLPPCAQLAAAAAPARARTTSCLLSWPRMDGFRAQKWPTQPRPRNQGWCK